MRFKKSLYLLSILIVALYSLASCSSDEKKASEIISKLPSSDYIVSANLIGETKNIITAELQKDSTVTIRLYDIAANKSDSIASFIKNSKIWEVIHTTQDNYVIITSLPREDGKEHNLFFAYILRNALNPKTSTLTQLFVDENKQNLCATGYLIDSISNKLALSSYDYNSESVTVYHTVYDFEGHRIVSDPQQFQFTSQKQSAVSSGGTGTYIWECQYCHEKRNSKKKPTIWEFTCHGRGEEPGFGNSHNWVKVGRVD